MENAATDFYRPQAATKEVAQESTTKVGRATEELERLALSNAMKVIRDDGDLAAIERRIENIVTTMTLARELADSLDLPGLERQLASIASALRTIEADDTVKELKAER
jgi:hypothetical protein